MLEKEQIAAINTSIEDLQVMLEIVQEMVFRFSGGKNRVECHHQHIP